MWIEEEEGTEAVVEDTDTGADTSDTSDDSFGAGDFEALFDAAQAVDEGHSEDDDGVAATADETEEVEATPKDATEAQPGEEVEAEAAEEAPVAEPSQEEPAVEQPAQEPPQQVDALDPNKVLADYEKWRTDAEELLATQHYALSEEQAEELDTSPSEVIPRLAARLHMEVMQQSVSMLAQIVPQIMQSVSQQQEQESAREQDFFNEWPELREHRDQVQKYGAVYMQVNPEATMEEFKRDVGAQVAVAMKVDLSARNAPPVEEAPKEPVHKPLSATGGSGAPAPVQRKNVFEELFEAALEHDQT